MRLTPEHQNGKSPHKAGFFYFICPRGELSPTLPGASIVILTIFVLHAGNPAKP